MAGWHHRLDGHEFEWAPGVGDGQGGLECCCPWGCKESDTTERLNWTDGGKKNVHCLQKKRNQSENNLMVEFPGRYSSTGPLLPTGQTLPRHCTLGLLAASATLQSSPPLSTLRSQRMNWWTHETLLCLPHLCKGVSALALSFGRSHLTLKVPS